MNNVGVDDINDLAQFIRQINGDNKMGAAELAENICRVKAMILRKQAEAVEDAANYVVGLGDKRTLLHYVQRLRQQADELEQNQ